MADWQTGFEDANHNLIILIAKDDRQMCELDDVFIVPTNVRSDVSRISCATATDSMSLPKQELELVHSISCIYLLFIHTIREWIGHRHGDGSFEKPLINLFYELRARSRRAIERVSRGLRDSVVPYRQFNDWARLDKHRTLWLWDRVYACTQLALTKTI